MLKSIGALLQLVFLILSTIMEKNKVKKEEKKKLSKELNDAIKSKDPSRVNAVIGRINRM